MGGYPEEPVIVFPRHAYVHIVIPRENSLVVECADGRTTYDEIGNMMLLAYPVNLSQDIVKFGMQLF